MPGLARALQMGRDLGAGELLCALCSEGQSSLITRSRVHLVHPGPVSEVGVCGAAENLGLVFGVAS